MGDAAYPLFPTFAFLGFVVGLIPLPWHLQAWNSGTCLYMIWVSVACLLEFVNAIIWHGNLNNSAPIWCDISTKIMIGTWVGIPASSLCINRRLYRISSMTLGNTNIQARRRAVFEDMAIALGIPALVMALHCVVQAHRFNILEDVGCIPDTLNTPFAYPLVFVWPVLLGLISFLYAALALRAFWRRRAQLNQLFSSSSALTTSRYLRLILVCCVEMVCIVLLGAFTIFLSNNNISVEPYISWADVHRNFSSIGEYPADEWMNDRPLYFSVELGIWVYPVCAFLFFALFGFAEEARRSYRVAFWATARRLGFQPPSEGSRTSSFRPSYLGLGAKKRRTFATSSPSIDTLPPYRSPKPGRTHRSRSLSSTILDSVVELNLDYDLEKATDSPATTSTTLSFPQSARTAVPKAPSEHFASVPPLSPDTPSYPLTEATVVPRHQRPFTSVIVPGSPSWIPAQGTMIQVHQEVTKVADTP